MNGLQTLSCYVDILSKYATTKGIKFRIENFANETPVVIHMIEKNMENKPIMEYEMYGTIEDGKVLLSNAKGEDIFELMKDEIKLSKKDYDAFIEEINSIANSYINK